VVSENFRPDVMDRWGLSYDEQKKVKPDIIFASLSGLGQTGPDSQYGTAGPVVQALAGLSPGVMARIGLGYDVIGAGDVG